MKKSVRTDSLIVDSFRRVFLYFKYFLSHLIFLKANNFPDNSLQDILLFNYTEIRDN